MGIPSKFQKFVVLPGQERAVEQAPRDRALPGLERVEELQQARTPAVETLREELQTPFTGGIGQRAVKGLVTGAKAAAVPFEAVEAGGARAIQKIQQPGLFEGETPIIEPDVGKSLQRSLFGLSPQQAFQREQQKAQLTGEVLGEAGRGIAGAFTGKEPVVEFGDTLRSLSKDKTFTNEVASSIFGLSALTATADPILFGAVSQSLSSLNNLRKAALTKGALRPSVFEKIIPVAQKWVDASDDVVRSSGKHIDQLFSGTKGATKVSQTQIDDIIIKLPDVVKSRLFSDDAKTIYGIKFIGDKVANTRRNLWQFRKFLDDIPTAKDFVTGATSKVRQAVVQGGNRARGILAGFGDDISNAMSDYSKVVRRRNFIRGKLIDSQSGFVKEGAKNILKQFQTKAVLREMADIIPETADLVRTVAGASRKAALGKGVKQVAKTAATIGLARAAFGGLGGGGGGGGGQAGGENKQ